MFQKMLRGSSGFIIALSLPLFLVRIVHAASAADPYSIFDSIPAPATSLMAAQKATKATTRDTGPALVAPDYDASKTRISSALTPTATVGGIDLGRMNSDPSYAAQMQAKMESMSMAERMAMAQQMTSSYSAFAPSPQMVAFLGQQRTADIAAMQKIRNLLDGELRTTGTRHREVAKAIDNEAKNCPTDKTGWPLEECTQALGQKAIAQHRNVEEAALGSEVKAFAQARAMALAEINKGKDLYAGARGGTAGPFVGWVLSYAQLLQDYADAITRRAGFWAHADTCKYTGAVTCSIKIGSDSSVAWPLDDSPVIKTGLEI